MYPDSSLRLNYQTATELAFFSAPFEPLNNWSAHKVMLWGQDFPTVEHGYHWRKFNNHKPRVAAEILATGSPWAALRVERQYATARRADWQVVKVDVMRELLRAKLAQHEDVREILTLAGTRTIIENSPWDGFWGLGPDGDGQNQLGRLWMELQAELAPKP
jgi:ribA/ribD-fused uncharacterized protein